MAESLYRKWRPRTFADLAGQEHVATTLTNALASGRVAQAYLFAGPRGTGKTSTGRLLGKALNCRNRQDGEPCNACESCQDFLAGRAIDLIEMDAASNRGIEEIRSLRDKVAFAPGAGDCKVYLIDEVHMLTDAAFNALLKTLEEPPPHVYFILATTDAHKVPATISSRCQRFDFRRIPLAAAVKTMSQICAAEGFDCEPTALELIARTATGSLRDAINLLDQMVTSYGSSLTAEHVRTGLGLIGDQRAGGLARLALNRDLAGGLALIASVRDDGLDLRQFQRELVDELRALLMVKSGLQPDEGATAERLADLRDAVAGVDTSQVLTALRAFGEADLKNDPNSTLPLDIALAECVLGPQLTTAAPVAAAATAPPTPPPAQRPAPAPPRRAEPAPAATAAARTAPPPVTAAEPPAVAPPSEPAPPPPPSPMPTVPVGNGLAGARAAMPSIYSEARAASAPLGALINSACDIIEVSDSELVIGFKYPVHADRAGSPANVQLLNGIVSKLMDRPMTVRCVLEPNVETWRQRETASRNPLVRAAQEMGARVLSSEPPEE